LVSKRKDSSIKGDVELQFSITDTKEPQSSSEVVLEKWQAMVHASQVQDDESPSRGGRKGSDDGDDDGSDETDDVSKKSKTGKSGSKKKRDRGYDLPSASDVVGVLYLEISNARDLPPERNSTS
jgi:phosphatidylserine decarboxylase